MVAELVARSNEKPVNSLWMEGFFYQAFIQLCIQHTGLTCYTDYGMSKKIWNVVVADEPHEIKVKSSSWTGVGEVFVDGRVVDAWGPSFTGGGARSFKVGSKDAILQSTALSAKRKTVIK
jgi:hypothetical protein